MAALPPLASDLAAWIGQAIPDEDLRAAAVLSAASSLVSGYAGKTEEWATNAPADVYAIVVQVAGRVYLSPPNPNIRSQAAGPFSEGYFDAAANGLYLTDWEMAVLNRFRISASGLGTISTTRDEGPFDPRQFVSDDTAGSDKILYYHQDDVGL